MRQIKDPAYWRKFKESKRKWKEEKLIKELEKKKRKEEEKEETEAAEAASGKGAKPKSPNPKGRQYTVSLALPGSILDNAQSAELRTYLAGQIARAAVVFNIDELIVFDETGSGTKSVEDSTVNNKGRCNIQLARILQYLECPQYLRKDFFPVHKDLEYASLLNPLACPHHTKADDKSPYREGIVTSKPSKEGKGSLVNVGLKRECQIDRKLQVGMRVTVKMDESESKKPRGKAVAPTEPRTEAGLYWGYSVRLASSLSTVFTQCPHPHGYDLTIGTSERGRSVDEVQLKSFSHAVIVLGGLAGLEASLDADEELHIEDPSLLFQHYLNTCPGQGSNTIRTEEAILISMSALRPKLTAVQKNTSATPS